MTIGEVSAKTGLPESTLRYYEKKGLLQISRTQNGQRDYAGGDIAWIAFIRRLKETGMPLKDIQRYSGLRYAGDSTLSQRLELLLAHREYVLEQQRKWAESLEHLEQKILFYQEEISRTSRNTESPPPSA